MKDVFAGGLEGREFCDAFKSYMYEMADHTELYFKLGGIETTSENVIKKLKTWRTGNLEEFSNLMLPTEIDYRYFNIRTRQWINKISKIVDDENYEPTFIVVGAVHVPGDNGLLKLLENEGYVLRRLEIGDEDQGDVLTYLSEKDQNLLITCIWILIGETILLFFMYAAYYLRKYFYSRNYTLRV